MKPVEKRLYIINSDQIVKTIWRKKGADEKYSVAQLTDFCEHDLTALKKSNWPRCHISHRALTRGEIVYKAN